MIKRAMIAALLGAGCDVVDLRSTAVPVARHYIKAIGAAGAVNVRKLPGNTRVTLIEMFDSRGAYLPRSMERKVETAFFREDFNRTDPDDLGIIEEANRAVEGYQFDFFRLLGEVPPKRKLRVVCDYAYSALGQIFPAMLGKLGVESISLNGYHDTKLAPRAPNEIERHVESLRQIVDSLGCEIGVLFTEEGERLSVVDDRGRVLEGNALFATLCTLVARTHPSASIGMSVTAPTRLEDSLKTAGVTVLRTKADTRSLMHTSLDAGVTFAGDDKGGFIFPEFHPGFDAAFTFAKLLAMLQSTGLKVSEVSDALPSFQLAYEQVRCPWESKGAVMRQISEESKLMQKVELLDGIKIYDHDRWVLVLPDAVEPLFHVYAETEAQDESRSLVGEYVRKIESLV